MINLKNLQNLDKNEKKTLTFENANRLLKESQKIVSSFESVILQYKKETHEKGHPYMLACVTEVSNYLRRSKFARVAEVSGRYTRKL